MIVRIYTVFLLLGLGSSLVDAQQVFNREVFSNIKIENLSEINTKDHESSAFWIGSDTLVYVKFKQRSKDDRPTRGERIFDLHWALRTSAGYRDMGAISKKINSNYVEGPGHYIAKAKTLFFTRSYRANRPNDDGKNVVKLKLYKSIKNGENWSEPRLMEGLHGEYNYCHPAYDAATNRLYFSSDIPGGFGAMDLYYSNIDADGNCQAPVNLGPQINTIDNEVFPTIVDSTLFYSNDGSGSLDIYVVGTAQSIKLPRGINSNKDDFSLIKKGNHYLFSSNRSGGQGKDDLYRFSTDRSLFKAKRPDSTIVSILVYDKDTKAPLPEAVVSIYKIDIAGGLSKEVILDDSDQLTVKYDLDRGSQLIVPKLPLSGEGSAFVILEKEHQYLIKTSLDNNNVSSQLIDVSQKNSIAIEISRKKKTNISAKPKLKHKTTPAISIPVVKGSIVIFENIYYDYNSATLKSGATAELDALAEVMLSRPSVKVQLSSHTDSRGREIYNQDLSDRRAASAKQYLVNKGIAPARIFDIGFGESRIRNHCKEGVSCTEAEHQFNRRTEVKILED